MICRFCLGWMLTHNTLKGWLRCITCSYNTMEKPIITFEMYVTACNRYKDRLSHSELTDDLKTNIKAFLDKVNAFLYQLGIKTVDISSGWRPSEVNANTPGSAKKSAHMEGIAVDLMDDKDQKLAKLFASKPEVLRQYGFFLEDPASTIGKNTNWAHIDSKVRTDRPSRIFKP